MRIAFLVVAVAGALSHAFAANIYSADPNGYVLESCIADAGQTKYSQYAKEAQNHPKRFAKKILLENNRIKNGVPPINHWAEDSSNDLLVFKCVSHFLMKVPEATQIVNAFDDKYTRGYQAKIKGYLAELANAYVLRWDHYRKPTEVPSYYRNDVQRGAEQTV
ncbi:hypothetical protein H4R33_005433 [Dimargaris cristalligena]|nr:hypothetical protein H4R33_005433 [Dimargaris cristalligena]